MNPIREGKRATAIEVFAYPELPDSATPDWEAWGGGGADREDAGNASAIPSPPVAPIPAEFERRLAEEVHRSFEAGRAQGIEQGRSAEQATMGTVQQRLAAQIDRLFTAFAGERDTYLHAVEAEVVKLALAVAARILRREAQMDPLLLTGAVRVALGQLAVSTTATLRVPAAELDLWRESIALLPNLAVHVEVAPGDSMKLGDCLLETTLGSVDLGVRAQLSEIERGFFDRAARDSAPRPETELAEARS